MELENDLKYMHGIGLTEEELSANEIRHQEAVKASKKQLPNKKNIGESILKNMQ